MTVSRRRSARCSARCSARSLQAAYQRLYEAYGPQGWWPARDRIEIMVGAVLVQHASWANAERAVRALRAAGVLSVRALLDLDEDALKERIRPAGAPSVKARRVKAVAQFIDREAGGSVDRLFAGVDDPNVAAALRSRLLRVHGVGPETADAILLYAGGAATFVVDAYARRILARHGWCDPAERYEDLQRRFESALPREAPLFNEYHALLVRVGKEHCRSRAPRCEGCPLSVLLPRGGPCSV